MSYKGDDLKQTDYIKHRVHNISNYVLSDEKIKHYLIV